ncbi:Symplekin tight junction protein C terminal family protein [Cryptosporidium felis]|nr:Symplekin tight junction protein C terminal family protein [Cryptosporidium felis]
MGLEIDDDESQLFSHFLQLSVQRKIQGLRFRQKQAVIPEANESQEGSGPYSLSKTEKLTSGTRFSSVEKNLIPEYVRAVKIISELVNDRFDKDYKVRVSLIKKLERILKIDSILTCVVIMQVSNLINDNNINVVKAIIDILYNQIEIIISNLFLPYSIKQINIERDEKKREGQSQVDQIREDPNNKDSWWESDICKLLQLGTSESLRSFSSIIQLISIIIETHGSGKSVTLKNGTEDTVFSQFLIDNEGKRDELFKKSLKLAYKLLRICMINEDILQDVKSNLLDETRNRINHQLWDYPNNAEVIQKKNQRVVVVNNSQNNYVYLNKFGCLLPIEIVLSKHSLSIFERIIADISTSIETSGKNLFGPNKNYLIMCFWTQFVGWICSTCGIYLNRFILSLTDFSVKLQELKEDCEKEKVAALRFVFIQELLRILASNQNYENIILFGEITSILNKLGKKGNLYEIRQEAINRFKFQSGPNFDDNPEANSNSSNNKHVIEENFPPIAMQKLRGKSSRYSYKRMKYDVENGFYMISPQSVIEGVSWLFSTHSYSNVIDIAINNFLNLRIPNDLLIDENSGESVGKKGVDLLLNSGKIPWTNEYSPFGDSQGSDFRFKDAEKNEEHDGYEKELEDVFAFNYQNVRVEELLGLEIDSSESKNVIEKADGLKKRDRDLVLSHKEESEILSTSYEMESLTHAINIGTWDSLRSNTNNIKSILFSQIITSVLVSPSIEMSSDGLYKVSKTLMDNNQLMNVLKYGQLILTSWELLLKRICESENKDQVTSDLGKYGQGVSIAWNLFVERVTSAFEILFYKYKLLIRLVLSKQRGTSISNNDLKLEQVFVDILLSTLLSETRELLTNILLISNISDEDNSMEMTEDYFVYLDNILYLDDLKSQNIQIANENSVNGDISSSDNNLKNIHLVFILWFYDYVLDQRVKIIHNLLFRFFHLDNKDIDKENQTEKVFHWLFNKGEMNLDIINEENENKVFFDYSKLFLLCFNSFTRCISEFNFKSNIFLSKLKSLVLNTPKIPRNFLRFLFNNWIFYTGSCAHDLPAQNIGNTTRLEINNIKREYAIEIFKDLLDSNYPVKEVRGLSYFVLVLTFLKNEINGNGMDFLESICLLGSTDVEMRTETSDSDGMNQMSNSFNFFEFVGELYKAENIQKNKKIKIAATRNKNKIFVEKLISLFYSSINLDNLNVDNSTENGIPERKVELTENIKNQILDLQTYLNDEHARNWSDNQIYGEIWIVTLSIKMIIGIVPKEAIFGKAEAIVSLLETNKFILNMRENLQIMISNELKSKYDGSVNLGCIFSYYQNKYCDNKEQGSIEEVSTEMKVSECDKDVDMTDQTKNNCGSNDENEDLKSKNADSYISYIEDLFIHSSLLFKYNCLRYPSLINCLIGLCWKVTTEINRYREEDKELRIVLFLTKIKDLCQKLFREILLLFKYHYTAENENLQILVKEYSRILDIYSSDKTRNGYLLEFITQILDSINFKNLELCTKVYDIFMETKNNTIVTPVIGFFDSQRIKEVLPIIINSSDKIMIKECIRNILTNPFAIKEKIISSSDLLLLLISYSYPDKKLVDKKKTVDVVDCCFELTQNNPPIFDSETIASVIGKIVQDDQPVFPRTLGRTLVLSVMYLPSIRSFIASFVISSLIRNCRVWEDTLTWRGVKHCIQKLWSDYKTSIFPSLILLPQFEFQGIFNELIETNSDLRVDCMDIIKKMNLRPIPQYLQDALKIT